MSTKNKYEAVEADATKRDELETERPNPVLVMLERIAVGVEFLAADKRASMSRSNFCVPGEEPQPEPGEPTKVSAPE